MPTKRFVILALESPFPPHGAVPIRLIEFMRMLEGEIHLIVFGKSAARMPLPAPFQGELQVIPAPTSRPRGGIHSLLMPFRRTPDMFANTWSPEYLAAIRDALATQPNSILAMGLQLGRYLEAVPNCIPRVLDNYDVVWLVHERIAQVSSSKTGFGRVLRRLEARRLRAWEGRVMSRATLVMAISEVDARELRLIAGGIPVQVVGPVFPCQRVTTQAAANGSEGPPALVFAGTFDHPHNFMGAQWFCRHVLPELVSMIGRVRVQLVGRGAGREVLGLANISGVEVVGEVPDVAPYLHQSRLAIVPLLWASGVRYKILEAFAAGTPVVTTTQGCKGLDVHDGEEVLIADNPRAFAEACRRAIEDPEMCAMLAERAHQFLEELNDRSKASFKKMMAGLDAGSERISPHTASAGEHPETIT